MRIFNGLDDLPDLGSPVVTVGSFDGVHTGHRELLSLAAGMARQRGTRSVVVTFSPHPREVLPGGEGVKLLTTLPEKAMLLERAGIDEMVVIPFTREFSELSSLDFVRDILVGKLGAGALVVGYNHHFGHDKQGDYGYLERLGEDLGFEVRMVPRRDVGDDKVSSTVVRRAVENGEMPEAGRRLGYPYFFLAHSDGRGGLTLPESSKLLPPAGEYSVTVGAGNVEKQAILSISADGELRLSGYAPPEGMATVTFG